MKNLTTEINAQIAYLEDYIKAIRSTIKELTKESANLTNSEDDLFRLSIYCKRIGRQQGELYAKEEQISYLKKLIDIQNN